MRMWIDTGLLQHPKLLNLTRDQRLTWLELLTYTGRTGHPVVPAGIRDAVPRATGPFLRRCVQVGLLDENDGQLTVHDWAKYQGSTAERVAAYLEANPDATAAQVQRAIAGKREAVLAAIRRHRGGGGDTDDTTDGNGFATVPAGFPNGSQTVPDRFPKGSPLVPYVDVDVDVLKPSPVLYPSSAASAAAEEGAVL